MSDYYDKKIRWRYKMKTIRFSKRFFVSGGVLLLLFAFILVSSNLSYTQQTIKRTVTPQKLMLKNDLTIKIVQCPKRVVKAGEKLNAGFQVGCCRPNFNIQPHLPCPGSFCCCLGQLFGQCTVKRWSGKHFLSRPR
jgi:hypothetical protein